MKSEGVEVSARTIDEAVALALEQLGLTRSEVEVEVLEKGKQGILGIGAEEARVLVKPIDSHAVDVTVDVNEVASRAKEVLEKLLSLMKVEADVELRTIPSQDQEPPHVALDIAGDDLGILIGRRGETLGALQYTVNLILGRQMKTRTAVTVDVEGYQKRREQSLISLANRMAERAKASGQTVSLEPMPAKERRIVHLALADDPEVTTESVGLGEGRKITISPKRK